MSEQENTRIVQEIYAAFARGDIPSILNALADQIEWVHHGTALTIPWAKTRKTRDEVAEFFQVLGQTMQTQTLDVQEYVAQGDKVVALGTWSARSKSTGRNLEEHWAMAWTLRDGKVVGYRAYDDTQAIAAALRPS